MTSYSANDVKILIDGVEVNGFPTDEPKEQLWYLDVKEKPFTISAKCEDGSIVEVPFNQLGYEKHIKPMKPTLKSPFRIKRVD